MLIIHCRGLLFDLDGVLVDSTPAVTRAWTSWALEHGFDPQETVRRASGRPSISAIRELLPGADHDAENDKMERRELADLEGVVPLPGALRLLGSLSADLWAIATSCSRPLAHLRIRAGGLPPAKHVITADDVLRGKPDPEPYLKAAASLGFRPQDSIVVEDSPAGIRAGKSSGACVLALRTTATKAELSAAGADWIVNDLAAVELDVNAADGVDGRIVLRIAGSL
jgi:mannitol-1-/sugar-/sorbitol-6-phosphatase